MNKYQDSIISNQKIAKDTYQMILASSLAKEAKPGQFVHIKIAKKMLRRPISIASINETSYTIIYKVVGSGTKILSELQAGTKLDVFGPLGSEFPIHLDQENILMIGGGVGVPPLYEVAKRYRALGKTVSVVLGFQNKDAIFYEQEFHDLGCQTYISTMDGSYGVTGTVMDVIEKNQILEGFVYSCGPLPLLKAVESKYQHGYVSFEARMACGIGVCMSCVCKDKKDKEHSYRICKEGPVFAIGKVEILC